MKKIKIFVFYFALLAFFCTTGAMCPEDNEEFLRALADLKEEVKVLQKQLDDLKEIRGKLQKEISVKDDKIRELKRDSEEIKKRCP